MFSNPNLKKLVADNLASAFSDVKLRDLYEENKDEKDLKFVSFVMNGKKDGFSIHFLKDDVKFSKTGFPMDKDPYCEAKFSIEKNGEIFSLGMTHDANEFLQKKHPSIMEIIKSCEPEKKPEQVAKLKQGRR